MGDITQATNGNEVTFSASSPGADQWMREKYGNHTVIFKFPGEAKEAEEFRKMASEAKFSISVL